MKSPFVACLRYKAYAFAWFEDSVLASIIANELKKAHLIQDISFYDWDIDNLQTQQQWTYLSIHGCSFYCCYHRSYKIDEVRKIGYIISKCCKKYENCNYKFD